MKMALVFLLALLPLLIGCGPEQTSLERDDAQIAANVAEERAVLAPLAGRYVGLLTYDRGGADLVAVYLSPMTIMQPNSGRDQISEIPTLSGSLNVCTKDGACFGPNDDETYVLPVAQFSQCTYDQGTNHFRLYSSGSSGGASASIDGQIVNGQFTGRYFTSLQNSIGTIDLTKAE